MFQQSDSKLIKHKIYNNVTNRYVISNMMHQNRCKLEKLCIMKILITKNFDEDYFDSFGHSSVYSSFKYCDEISDNSKDSA